MGAPPTPVAPRTHSYDIPDSAASSSARLGKTIQQQGPGKVGPVTFQAGEGLQNGGFGRKLSKLTYGAKRLAPAGQFTQLERLRRRFGSIPTPRLCRIRPRSSQRLKGIRDRLPQLRKHRLTIRKNNCSRPEPLAAGTRAEKANATLEQGKGAGGATEPRNFGVECGSTVRTPYRGADFAAADRDSFCRIRMASQRRGVGRHLHESEQDCDEICKEDCDDADLSRVQSAHRAIRDDRSQ